mgnify:CR=1 FL=1
MKNNSYIYIEPEKYLMDILALLRSFYPEHDIKPVVPESREDVKVKASGKGYFFSIKISDAGDADIAFKGRNYSYSPQKTSPKDFTAYKKELCRELYAEFSNDTGRQLPWGTMNGVRPTKPAFIGVLTGRGKSEVSDFYKKEYLVTDEKINTSWDIARAEVQVLSGCEHREQSRFGDRRGYTAGYSVYVGIPFCPSKCLYCSFASYPLASVKDGGEAYVDALLYEMKECRDIFPGRAPDSVYMGGGTPTALSAEQLHRIISVLEDFYFTGPSIEFTVEAGRADSITEEKLRVLKKHGISRISVNPQTFNQKTLDLIGRKASSEDTVRAFNIARELAFDNINMDIILGLPGEGADEVRRTCEVIEKLRPDSLTVHSLALKRASGLGEWIDKNGHENILNTEEIQDIAKNCALSIGFEPYYLYRQKDMSGGFENVGYSAPGKECLYNIVMMEEVQSILGFGAGTISKCVKPAVSSGTGFDKIDNFGELIRSNNELNLCISRSENFKDVKDYTGRLPELTERKKILFS